MSVGISRLLKSQHRGGIELILFSAFYGLFDKIYALALDTCLERFVGMYLSPGRNASVQPFPCCCPSLPATCRCTQRCGRNRHPTRSHTGVETQGGFPVMLTVDVFHPDILFKRPA